ncbi:MAG: hypothetical protein ACI9RY_001547, partial [Reinekea sp.]
SWRAALLSSSQLREHSLSKNWGQRLNQFHRPLSAS